MDALRRYALIVGLTLAYYLAGKAGLQFFGLLHPSASAIWIPTGIAIASLLIFGYRVWPAIFAGAFLVNVTTHGSIATSLGVAAGNTLEGVVAAYLVNRFADGTAFFTHAANIFRFAALAGLVSTAVSATIGVASLTLGGYALAADFQAIWFTWWLGDAAGAIVVTPLLVLWYVDRDEALTARQVIQSGLLYGLFVIVGSMTFFHPWLASYPLVFLCLPPLVWAAFRFGQREVASAVALLSLIAIWATATGHGPFVMQSPNESLLVLQGFVAVIAITALSMAALIGERTALVGRERTARVEAEAAVRAKDEFLAILSHELRNPLSAISAAGAVLRITDEGATDQTRWREIVHRQTEQLSRLVDDLLDVAKVSVDKMTLDRQPMDLAEAVKRCLHTRASDGTARYEVRTEPTWIHADPNRIRQIIDNLLSNAIKFTPFDGRISVTVAHEADSAVLQIEDAGAGIDAEFLPRVFEPFLQGEQDLARPLGGLGIGLTVVRRLTELHGGTVEAGSRGKGQGSSFVVRLPRIDAPPLLPSDVSTPRPSVVRAYRILIVEDNADTRHALRALMEQSGCSVHESEDGSSGIDAALTLPLDFVLLDIGLPRLDGYEVARRLKAAKPELPLIALTGYGREEDRERAAHAGFDAHMLKPVRIEKLLEVMHELFTRQQNVVVKRFRTLC